MGLLSETKQLEKVENNTNEHVQDRTADGACHDRNQRSRTMRCRELPVRSMDASAGHTVPRW